MTPFRDASFAVEGRQALPLDRALRTHYQGASWNEVRKLIRTGKVCVAQQVVTENLRLVEPGQVIAVRMTAARRPPGIIQDEERVLYCDRQLIVLRKPAGMSSVDHAVEPTSLQSEARAWLRRKEARKVPPLLVVHRLDKVTSGVMMFARTQAAQGDLKHQFRVHSTGRVYLAVALGAVRDGTLSSRLVKNRGDGIRGVTQDKAVGHHAVTHVRVVERLARCTLLECRLETGRTHQIRIHLSAAGHPLVGDPLYARDFRGRLLESSRTLLHAARLSFDHPVTRKRLEFEEPAPAEFEEFLARERNLRS